MSEIIVFAKLSDQEPDQYELTETSTMEELIACVASKYDVGPENVTILLDDKICKPDTLITSYDLGNILYFDVVISKQQDQYIDEMFDIEEQRKIEAQIRQENINHNLQYAYDNNPESFIMYSSPFIKCYINGVEVVALIDTGAQISILPHAIAKKCNVEYLIDTRFKSITIGVGRQQSQGVIHALNVKVGGEVWSNKFTVLDDTLDHVILGIDWMKKNRAIIDLANNVLILHDQKIQLFDRDKCT